MRGFSFCYIFVGINHKPHFKMETKRKVTRYSDAAGKGKSVTTKRKTKTKDTTYSPRGASKMTKTVTRKNKTSTKTVRKSPSGKRRVSKSSYRSR